MISSAETSFAVDFVRGNFVREDFVRETTSSARTSSARPLHPRVFVRDFVRQTSSARLRPQVRPRKLVIQKRTINPTQITAITIRNIHSSLLSRKTQSTQFKSQRLFFSTFVHVCYPETHNSLNSNDTNYYDWRGSKARSAVGQGLVF